MQQPDTDFCGYSVPHPYEPKMNVRLQTKNTPTIKVLQRGFVQMEQMCDIMSNKFDAALEEYLKHNTIRKTVQLTAADFMDRS